MNELEQPTDDSYEKPSKTSLKRESAELQTLAAELAELPPVQLQALELPETVLNSIIEASQLPAKGARKRLLKYIGGLLREMDCDAVKEKLAQIKNQSAHSARQHHQVERWRERLLEEGDSVLTEFLNSYPDADRQQLRQLLRNAKQEQIKQKPPRYSRELFRFLRQLIQEEKSS